MKRMALGLLMLLCSAAATAVDPYPVIDFTKVDARQYCVYNGQLYTRGIRIKTDTGTYTCRLTDTKPPGPGDAVRETLSWVREAL